MYAVIDKHDESPSAAEARQDVKAALSQIKKLMDLT